MIFFDVTLKFSDKANSPKAFSPNIQYKELDKSVDWQEVLLQKQMRRVAKGLWVSLLKLLMGLTKYHYDNLYVLSLNLY